LILQVLGVIPARYDSKRFPGKSLFKIRGKTLLEWVYTNSKRSRLINRLIIATDDSRIADCAKSFGAEVFLSGTRHNCGSERVAEVASRLKYPIVVNIQGDEISINSEIIRLAVNALKSDSKAWVGTIVHKIDNTKELNNPDLVKVVVDNHRRALYFSRNPIPYISAKNIKSTVHYGHIGIYAFRNKCLQMFAGIKQGQLEKIEKLEQLRVLENGGIIAIAMTKNKLISINRPRDVKSVERILNLQDK
jgi:3-deoxy-manno-octulosonate cytidylyltransferase (CMP-KDO synthetase)